MSPLKSTFLEADSSITEKNLRFIRDEAEEEFNSIFQPVVEQAQSISSGKSKIVKPSPGFCLKAFVKDSQEKFFINICQTDGIPAPEDITEEQLLNILNDGAPGSFKIPMSITQPRQITDNSAKQCQVCDIAVNCKFFKRIETPGLMRDFMITIVFEGLSSKYNITLDDTNFRVLKNKKCIDKLIMHHIENRDVKSVYESYRNPTEDDLRKIEELSNPRSSHSQKPTKRLIEEIDAGTMKTMKDEKNKLSGKDEYVPDPTKVAISQASCKRPDCRLFKEPAIGKARVLMGEFYLPKCTSSKEITLDIGEDRILLEARKKGYLLDVFVDYPINSSKVSANFNLETRMLNVVMPVLAK
ncbi:PIH1 domain-containing protein 1 [Sabethes cyaneus]|uniref:PIH1 domain-containing protein 1 n=1 Tax=Sabethes cyaneus TaxID=53552 RepID=UPI00237E206D|nr:PIH1 domain-containing protein 1 [Sabethes cyaneus]XP_053695525.1 PIH1 domain-containing protein 1 [Sabethes cyaneus]XP_053695526.1 PIH1 domain-containing protein 1 [Sabethes cyaneus]